MSDEPSIGEVADEVKRNAPKSIFWRGWRLTYGGEVQLPNRISPDGIYRPFPVVEEGLA